MSEIMISMVTRIFADHCSDAVAMRAEDGEWPEALWRTIEAAGLPLALIATGEHSLGVPVEEAFQIVRLAGKFAAPVPMPEPDPMRVRAWEAARVPRARTRSGPATRLGLRAFGVRAARSLPRLARTAARC